MVEYAWKKMWEAATEARRWLLITNALDILSEAYEQNTAIPATAMLTPDGVCIEMEFEEGAIVEFLEPDDIAELSPQAYAILQRAKILE